MNMPFWFKLLTILLNLSGCGLLLFQLFLYPVAERTIGAIMLSRLAAVCFFTKLILSGRGLFSFHFEECLKGFMD